MFKVLKTNPNGLILNLLEENFDGEGRKPEDFLVDIVVHHLTDDASSARYIGWEAGVFTFSYTWGGEERVAHLAVEEVKEEVDTR